ncbi:MAG TPA: pitrilysin family protein [Vicinamibacterales bacterium]|nr:pitrilysin family protein [Vicinamibacterales bacterium]HOG29334.1 pitrilysin family protein [Vicinamibacterales bacterium]HOQ60055.1 pitrilysin family protein [Vicinamibacterales bacterium]HPW19686.1 pitrilysin family protein [Vicinamibacterales bacterium]
MIVREVLDNGLRLLSEPLPHVRSVSLGVWLARGSRHEGDASPGIAHFVEHMLFKGTTTRTAEEIAQAVDSVGGQMDAATGKENANYGIKVLDEHLGLAVDVLSDVVLHPKFAPADIEREKSVVAEEIKMVEDMPDDLVHELFIERFWAGHPLGRSILGTPDSVEALTREALQAYFSRVHTASNFVVAAAGSFDYERLRDLVQEAFGSLPRGGGEPEDAPPSAHGVLLVRTKDLEQSHVCLGAGAYPQNHASRYAALVFNTLLGGSMSSRLFQNVREKRGLAYSVSSGLSAFRDAGLLTIYAGCANTKVDEVVRVIMDELRAAVAQPVAASDLARAKDNVKGGLILGLESTWQRAANLARQELYFGEPFTLDETLAGIDAVTADDVARVAQELLAGAPLSLAVVGAVDGWTITEEDLQVTR